MTGKEALEKLLDALKHWQGRNTIFDKIHSKHILDELELLEKYKRAFEILNRDKELTLHKGKDPILGTEEYKLSFVNWKSLTKEEYELLEELMGNENTK